MARAAGPAASRRAAHGRDPDHRAVPAADDAAAAARAMAGAEALSARGDQPAPPARRCTAASSIACCSPSPSPAATSISAPLFDDPLFVAYPAGEAPRSRDRSTPPTIDENRLLLLEDGHCLKDHALSACNRPELRAHAAMMGTSLHTLVQMVDNGLGADVHPGNGDRGRASSPAPASTPAASIGTPATAASR